MPISGISRGLKSLCFAVMVKISGLFKMSYVFGSFAAFFSASNCIIPLSGAFGGIQGSVALFAALFSLKLFITGSCSWHMLAFYLPGLCASLYWARNHWLIRVFLPALCMILFVAHPVGMQAALYSCFWIIPVALYVRGAQGIIAHSFGSTFVAHAVGSVIWLYTLPMTPAVWLALIPVVILERTVFAFGMAGAHAVISSLYHWSPVSKILLCPRMSK